MEMPSAAVPCSKAPQGGSEGGFLNSKQQHCAHNPSSLTSISQCEGEEDINRDSIKVKSEGKNGKRR